MNLDDVHVEIARIIADLPRCHQCDSDSVATHTRYDAAGDPWPSCAEHAVPGGIDRDERPDEITWVTSLLRLCERLATRRST